MAIALMRVALARVAAAAHVISRVLQVETVLVIIESLKYFDEYE